MIIRAQRPTAAVGLTAAALALAAAVMIAGLQDDRGGSVASTGAVSAAVEVPSWEIALLQARATPSR